MYVGKINENDCGREFLIEILRNEKYLYRLSNIIMRRCRFLNKSTVQCIQKVIIKKVSE